MNTQISKTILEKIHGEHIKPKARWYFVLKHMILWVPGIAVTIIGTIAVAGELYAITHTGWEFREFIYPTPIDFIIAAVPLVWLISLVLFSSLIVKALRTTHSGYRFTVKNILLVSAIASLVGGYLVFVVDSLLKVESVIRYPIQEREQKIWFSPTEGRISGFIEEKNDDTILVRDKEGSLWIVDISGFSATTTPFLKKGESIRIVGNRLDEGFFVACAVFPWDIGSFPRPVLIKGSYGNASLQPIRHTNANCSVILETIKQRTRERN